MVIILSCAAGALLLFFLLAMILIKLRKTESALRAVEVRLKREQELRRVRSQSRNSDERARIGAVTSWLAHELRQPLSAILSNAGAALQFLKQENPNLDEIREILNDIIADENRASAVIARVSDALRRKEMKRDKTSLASVIREALALLQDEIADRGMVCTTRLETDFEITAEKAQIREVLISLVSNALEAVRNQPADRRRLEVRLTEGKAGWAQVTLSDTGQGVPEPRSAKLFEPFQAGRNQGMGIGLSICRSIIQAHGGSIWSENNPDGGATFAFTLPLENTVDLEPRSPGLPDVEDYSPSAAAEDAERQPQNARILLIDDSEPYRRATWSLLRGNPHIELSGEAADGIEAVRKAGDLKPDVVLLDISLSGINGIDAASQIRIVSPHTKIIFLSQYDDPEVTRGVLHTGALGYVLKTDAAKELVIALRAVLRGERYLSTGLRDVAGAG